jgi:hypothetical protein
MSRLQTLRAERATLTKARGLTFYDCSNPLRAHKGYGKTLQAGCIMSLMPRSCHECAMHSNKFPKLYDELCKVLPCPD